MPKLCPHPLFGNKKKGKIHSSAMKNTRNSYSSSSSSSLPNQSDSYDSGTRRSSGWRVPVFSSQNSWSRTDSIGNRPRLLDDPPSAYSRTTISSTIESHTPIRSSNSNNLRRQHLEAQRQAVHNQQPARPDTNSRSSASQVREEEGEDDVLKHLIKQTYNPIKKSLLLRNLSLYYRNKNPGSENSRNPNEDEEEKRCTVCLEDFEPKETVMLTPCKHMFHEECIVRWLKSKGQCPVCRSIVVKPAKRDSSSSSPAIGSGLTGEMTVNDLFTLELMSVVRAMEETFLFGYPRR